MDLVLRAARPEERDTFFAIRRDAFRGYAELAFGPWDDVAHRSHADRDFAALPVEVIERRAPVACRCSCRCWRSTRPSGTFQVPVLGAQNRQDE